MLLEIISKGFLSSNFWNFQFRKAKIEAEEAEFPNSDRNQNYQWGQDRDEDGNAGEGWCHQSQRLCQWQTR